MPPGAGTISGCRAFTDLEIAQLYRYFVGRHGGRDLALFTLGLTTGFRIAELRSLRVGDVTNGRKLRKSIVVPRRHTKGKRQGRRRPLKAEAAGPMLTWLDTLRRMGCALPRHPLFLSRQSGRGGSGRAITRIQWARLLRQACEAEDIEYPGGTHAMRKTTAVWARKASGGDIFKVQEVLGHKNVSSTQAYLPNMTPEEREELDRKMTFGMPSGGPLFERKADEDPDAA